MTWVIIIGGVILIILLIVGVVISSNSERSALEERLSQYLDADKTDVDKEAQKYALTNWVSKRVEKTSFGDRIARQLARADLKFKVAEYFALIFISVFLFSLVAWFLGNRHPVSALIGLVIGAIVPGQYVRAQQKQRLRRFNDQLQIGRAHV